jgi:hypothetical protein
MHGKRHTTYILFRRRANPPPLQRREHSAVVQGGECRSRPRTSARSLPMPTFLIDADVRFARDWVGGRIASPRWHDRTVVQSAWDDGSTIVTANGSDFVRYMLEHQRSHPCRKDKCHDLAGLIVIPNHEFRAKRAFDAVSKRGLRAGRALLSLDDISQHNLYVKLHLDGSAEIRRFPLCPYREDADDQPPWYAGVTPITRSGIPRPLA